MGLGMRYHTQVVKIGDIVVSDNPEDVLVAYGLSSCVAVCLFDPMVKVGGMLHALLPAESNGRRRPIGNPAQYVDQGVKKLIDSMLKMGARRIWIKARLCGGANMLPNTFTNKLGNNGFQSVGERNVQAAEKALKAARIRINAGDTGGTAGRTVKLNIRDGKVVVKTLGGGEKILD